MGPGGMMSFGAVMKLIEDHDLKVPPEKQAVRYVSMSVTETMASRSVSRKTVMTFDKDGDMQFVGQAGVEFFAKNSPYPGKLLESTNDPQRWNAGYRTRGSGWRQGRKPHLRLGGSNLRSGVGGFEKGTHPQIAFRDVSAFLAVFVITGCASSAHRSFWLK
jgi:hypothetical protein